MGSELESVPTYLEVYATDTIINGQNSKKLIHLDTVRLASQMIPTDSFDLGVKPIKYFFYKDDYGYLIDCGVLPFTFDYYKSIFDNIVGSFTFKN